MKICPAYILKSHSNCEKRIITLMISNEEKEVWHYLSVKKVSALLKRITSKHNGDFYCLNWLPFFEQEINSNFKKTYVKIKFFVEM